MVNITICFNNLKAKVHDLNFGKLKTVFVDKKKISDVVDNEVVTNNNSRHWKQK